MALEKPRLVRLSSILTQLQSGRLVTATDIADKHGISIRTVYRDIRSLEASGIPILTEEGRGYSIMEGYVLPPVMFTQEEANALITAEQIIQKNTDQSFAKVYRGAITKIKSILKFSQKEKTEMLESRIQIRAKKDIDETSDFLMRLQSAIINYEVMQIDYLSLENKRSQRDIEPFALFSTQDKWILVAWCRLKDNFRAFRLDCIQQMKPVGMKFTPHKITLFEYFDQCREKWGSTPDTPMT
jgi:predicted DNA-binding transcriptional regulator YafY